MKYDGCFSGDQMNGAGTLSDVTGAFTYTGLFLDDDFDYRTILGEEPSKVREMMPSLEQTVSTDCFYLTDNSFGAAMRCGFASADKSAEVLEVFVRPISGTTRKILAADKINAPTAKSVKQVEDAQLPAWAASIFGIERDSVKCYAAYYDGLTVFYWTDKVIGTLLLKSAEVSDGTAGTGNSLADGSADEGLTQDEIISLFEELGLDINDFASLGFDAE